MRKLILPALMIGVFLLQSFENAPTPLVAPAPISLGEVVYAVQLRKKVPLEQLQQDWHYEYIDPFKRDSLFAPIFQKVVDKQIEVRIPEYPFNAEMNRDSAYNSVAIPYEAEVENEFGDIVIAKGISYIQPEDVVAVLFHEEWYYDALTLTLEKKVKGIIPLIDYGYAFNGDGYDRLIRPAFYIPMSDKEPVHCDFQVGNITYDFVADSILLSDFPTEDRYITQQAYHVPDIKSIGSDLLVSLKGQMKSSKVKIYEAEYPSPLVGDRKKRSSLVLLCDSADNLRFRESWKFDIETRSFTKVVHGVYLGNASIQLRNDFPFSGVRSVAQYLYLPLNNDVPSFVPKGKVRVENYYFSVLYGEPSRDYYTMLSHKDSMAIATTATEFGKRLRSNISPCYNLTELFQYNDPLDQRRVPLTSAMIENMYIDSELVYAVDPISQDYFEQYFVVDKGHENYCGLGFAEAWYFDPGALTFEKKIKSVGLLMFENRGIEEELTPTPWLFADNPNQPVDSIRREKYLVARDVVSPCLLNQSEFYPDEDDLGKVVPQYYLSYQENIVQETRFVLVQQVIDLVASGKLVAWKIAEPNTQFSIPEFRKEIASCAAGNNLSPQAGLEYYVFNEIKFVEDWYYNPGNGQFYKQVKALKFGHRKHPFVLAFAVDRDAYESAVFMIKVNGIK